MSGRKGIVVICNLDTRGEDIVFVKDLIAGRGHEPILLDFSMEEPPPFGRGAHDHRPRVLGVRRSRRQPVPLEGAHEPGHRRCGHLLRAREAAHGRRPAEDEHGERRQPGGRQTRLVVDPASGAEKMNGRRVQAIGGGADVAGRC